VYVFVTLFHNKDAVLQFVGRNRIMAAPRQSRKALPGRPPVAAAEAATKLRKLDHGPTIEEWKVVDNTWISNTIDLRTTGRPQLLAINRNLQDFQAHLLRKSDRLLEAIDQKEAELAELRKKLAETQELAASADKDKEALEEYLRLLKSV
jgi:hypothetical protein